MARLYDISTVKRVAFGLYCGILATSLQNSYFIFSLVHVSINIVLWLLHELIYMLLLVYPAKCLCDYSPYEKLDRIPRGVQLDSDRSPCGI